MKIESAGGTHIGRVRTNNEDNFYINKFYKKDVNENVCSIANDRELPFYTFAVCDGMGGENFGETASLIAVETLAEFDDGRADENINSFIEEANKRICNEIENNGGQRIGTTVSLLTIKDKVVKACNVGDSRIYCYRDGVLTQLSHDHSRAQQLVDAGIISAEQARTHKMKNTLTQHLGIFPHEFILDPYLVTDITLQMNDVFLLCSDGVTDMVTDDELLKILKKNEGNPVKDLINEILASALDAGGKDNTTIIAIRVL